MPSNLLNLSKFDELSLSIISNNLIIKYKNKNTSITINNIDDYCIKPLLYYIILLAINQMYAI